MSKLHYLIELFLILSFLSTTIFTNKIVCTRSVHCILIRSYLATEELLFHFIDCVDQFINFENRNISVHTFLFFTIFSVLWIRILTSDQRTWATLVYTPVLITISLSFPIIIVGNLRILHFFPKNRYFLFYQVPELLVVISSR